MILKNAFILISVMALAAVSLPDCSFRKAPRGRQKPDNTVIRYEHDLHANEFIPIKVVIGKQVCRFVIDTGTDSTIADQRLRHLFGRSTGVMHGNRPVDKIVLDGEVVESASPFMIADAITYEGPVEIYDLSKLGVSSDYDGIIGMNVLKHFTLSLDYQNGRIELVSDMNSIRPGGTAYPVTIEHGKTLSPYVTMDSNDFSERFLVDTGLIGMAFLRKEKYAQVAEACGEMQTVAQTPSGPVDVNAVYIKSLVLGRLKYKALPFISCNISLLGSQFLQLHKQVIFDFKNSTLYLCP